MLIEAPQVVSVPGEGSKAPLAYLLPVASSVDGKTFIVNWS